MNKATSKGRKATFLVLELNGVRQKVTACPYRQRLCVVGNQGARKGYYILRVPDGALVAWARLKGHATTAMEEMEIAERLVLTPVYVNKIRMDLMAL